MTIDEELSKLEENLRRLKIEYEIYFSGGSPRPPSDLVFRVEKTIKKYNAGTIEMSFRQRYRFNQLTQSYAVHNDLWRKKMKVREEGPAAPVLHGLEASRKEGKFSISWSDPDLEKEKVDQLLQALIHAKSNAGEGGEIDPQVFADFIREKTRQFKQSLACDSIQFSVDIEEGRVKLRAAKAE